MDTSVKENVVAVQTNKHKVSGEKVFQFETASCPIYNLSKVNQEYFSAENQKKKETKTKRRNKSVREWKQIQPCDN